MSLAICSTVLSAQSAAKGEAKASGGCAVAHSGNNDVITIQNCGIGKDEADKIVEMLRVVLANQKSDSRDAKLDELLELARKAANPYETTVTYQPDGVRRSFSPSTATFTVEDGGSADFRTMIDMQREGQWPQMIALARKDMDAYPGWFTPYAFLGEADFHLCQKKEATDALTKFVNDTAGATTYAKFRDVAQHILSELKTTEYERSCQTRIGR